MLFSTSFSTYESRKPLTHVFPTALPLKDVLIISYNSDVVFLSLKQNTMQMHQPFKSVIGKSNSTLIMDDNKHQLTS
jgi:hypothetical protein